jgi:GH35 family endo-1,4-beta-xylanase
MKTMLPPTRILPALSLSKASNGLKRSVALLLTAAALAALPLHAQSALSKIPESASLRDAYKGIFHMGVAINENQIGGRNPQAEALILKEYDCISPENVMKMGPIHPRAGNDDSSYNFGPADAYVDFGVKNKLFVIGHNLCWHSQMPGWMSQPDAGQATLTKEVLLQRLKDHIFKVAGRYKGKVNGWDVVNEALADNANQSGNMPMGLRSDSPWNRIVGSPEYILMAFKWAHEAAPDAELYYNDYNLDASDYKRANCVELIKYLKENGAHITGVGMQGHYNATTPTAAKIDETIKMFAALGVKVMITELDVRAGGGGQLTGAVGAGGPPAGGAPRGAAARGGAPATPAGPPVAPPSLDTLKTALSLTDAQVTQITPLLDTLAKAYADTTAAGTRSTTAMTDASAKISALLNEAQRGQFAGITGARGGGARGGRGGGSPILNDEQQQTFAKRYGEIFAVFVANRNAITRVTFWGLSDPESWRASDSPLLHQTGYVRKAAYDAVYNAAKAAGGK